MLTCLHLNHWSLFQTLVVPAIPLSQQKYSDDHSVPGMLGAGDTAGNKIESLCSPGAFILAGKDGGQGVRLVHEVI